MYVYLLTLCLFVNLSNSQDICTNQASLVLFDEFYLSQSFESEIKLNFSNYISELNKISEDVVPFENNALKYDTESELDELEPKPLIPYTVDTNLIHIKSTHLDFMRSCAALDAKVLDINPYNIDAINKIMRKLNIDKVPFRTFYDRGAQISSVSGFAFKNAPEPTQTQQLLLKYLLPIYTLTGSSPIVYPTNDTVTDVTKIDGFCMKSNNIWDHKGPARNKWLTLISKIISNISLMKSWKDSFSTLFSDLPVIDQLYAKQSDKLTPNTPLALSGISNFLSKFKSNSNWEASTPSDFPDFQNFVKNFKALSKIFLKMPSFRTRSSLFANISEPKISELVAAPFDTEVFQRFLDLHPDKVNITGPVSIKPIYKIRGQEGIIGVQARFKIYDSNDKIKIYQVKPLVFHGFVTTVTHVVVTSKNKLAITRTPTPFGCQTQEENAQKEENIKICKGYTTPGLEILSAIDSDICGVALSSREGEIDFAKCPQVKAPSTPLAYRVACENRTVVISSNKPLKIRVFCDGFSGTATTLLESFPVYLHTNCEIRQVERNGFEPVLLPQLHSDFLMQQPVADIEIPDKTILSFSEQTTLSPSANITTDNPPVEIIDSYFYISITSITSFIIGIFIFIIIKRKAFWNLILRYFCCCSAKYNPFGCKDPDCCKSKCCGKNSSDSDTEADDEPTNKKKKSKHSNKEAPAVSVPLLPLPPSAPGPSNYDHDSFLEPDFPTGNLTPTSVKSIRDGLNTYGRQQPRVEKYNNTYNK
jgi:hypothetical protein